MIRRASPSFNSADTAADASSTITDPAYSAGSFVTFLTDTDLLANGNTSVEVYLVNLFKLGPASVP